MNEYRWPAKMVRELTVRDWVFTPSTSMTVKSWLSMEKW